MDQWIDAETEECHFQDKRIGDRFVQLINAVASSPGKSIPQICRDWYEAKGVYRFLSNTRVAVDDILAGHFCQSAKRGTRL